MFNSKQTAASFLYEILRLLGTLCPRPWLFIYVIIKSILNEDSGSFLEHFTVLSKAFINLFLCGVYLSISTDKFLTC